MSLAEALEIVHGNYLWEGVLVRITPYLPAMRAWVLTRAAPELPDSVAGFIRLLREQPADDRAQLERTILRETGESVAALIRRAQALEFADPKGAEALRVVLLAELGREE